MRFCGQPCTKRVSRSVKYACGLTPLSLQVSMRDAKHAQFSPPSSLPANKLFFSRQAYRPHGALDSVVVELDASVFEEPLQPIPVVQRVADCLGDWTASAAMRCSVSVAMGAFAFARS
jgi:hypothetical protein